MNLKINFLLNLLNIEEVFSFGICGIEEAKYFYLYSFDKNRYIYPRPTLIYKNFINNYKTFKCIKFFE